MCFFATQTASLPSSFQCGYIYENVVQYVSFPSKCRRSFVFSFARLWLKSFTLPDDSSSFLRFIISLSNFPSQHPNFVFLFLDLILKFRLVGVNGCDYEFLALKQFLRNRIGMKPWRREAAQTRPAAIIFTVKSTSLHFLFHYLKILGFY